MERYKAKNRTISNTLFNLALDRAREDDLSNALVMLKKSLKFYKANVESRNLLGLIYYREGEIVNAIIQWTLSKNFQTQSNKALEYLMRLEKDKDTEVYFEAIKNYNIALENAKIGRKDLAMVYLYKAVDFNPNYLKALNLLGLLLIEIKDHIKAGYYLIQARNIDKTNFQANKYMNYVISKTGKKEAKERKIENVYSIKKLEADDAVVPHKYIKLSTNQKVIFTVIGIVVGFLSYATLISPIVAKSFDSASKTDVVKFAEKVNEQNKTIRDLTIENTELKDFYNEASVRLKAYEEQNKTFTAQYETLNEIIELFDNGYISRAAKEYVDLDKESITDDTLVSLLNTARSKIEGIGAKRLCELGTESWNGGNKNQAIAYYQLSLSINPNDPETMFLLARLHQNMGKTKEANELFDKIIGQHPDSKYAVRSREARGY